MDQPARRYLEVKGVRHHQRTFRERVLLASSRAATSFDAARTLLGTELGALHPNRVPVAGRQQGQVSRPPAGVKEGVVLVVGGAERLRPCRRPEPDLGTVTAARVHPERVRGPKAAWTWRLLRRLWSSASGSSGTGGRPIRGKIRWFSSV